LPVPKKGEVKMRGGRGSGAGGVGRTAEGGWRPGNGKGEGHGRGKGGEKNQIGGKGKGVAVLVPEPNVRHNEAES